MSDASLSGPGVIQCVQESFRQLIADCHGWRDWQGCGRDRDAALMAIYHDALPPPRDMGVERSVAELSRLRPFAIVSTDPFGGYRMDFDAAIDFTARGRLRLLIEQDRPSETFADPSKADTLARASLGHLIYTGDPDKPGIVELVKDSRMQITGITASGPMSPEDEEIEAYGECQWLQLDIEWQL